MIRDTEALLQGAFPCLVWTASGGFGKQFRSSRLIRDRMVTLKVQPH